MAAAEGGLPDITVALSSAGYAEDVKVATQVAYVGVVRFSLSVIFGASNGDLAPSTFVREVSYWGDEVMLVSTAANAAELGVSTVYFGVSAVTGLLVPIFTWDSFAVTLIPCDPFSPRNFIGACTIVDKAMVDKVAALNAPILESIPIGVTADLLNGLDCR
jgi:hypothetical protein